MRVILLNRLPVGSIAAKMSGQDRAYMWIYRILWVFTRSLHSNSKVPWFGVMYNMMYLSSCRCVLIMYRRADLVGVGHKGYACVANTLFHGIVLEHSHWRDSSSLGNEHLIGTAVTSYILRKAMSGRYRQSYRALQIKVLMGAPPLHHLGGGTWAWLCQRYLEGDAIVFGCCQFRRLWWILGCGL